MTEEPIVTNKKKKINASPFVATIVIISIIFFLVLIGFSFLLIKSQNLSKENNQRITDIQLSRVLSCKQNYEGIKDVFSPFFPPPPRTSEQQANLDKFNKTVSDLKRNCIKQTRVPQNIELPENKET